MEGWDNFPLSNTQLYFPARKKQADKLKKLSSVKTDSCETESVNDDGKDDFSNKDSDVN